MLKLTLALKKETKGTVVYEATDEEAALRSLYIVKTAVPQPFPPSVTVNITFPAK